MESGRFYILHALTGHCIIMVKSLSLLLRLATTVHFSGGNRLIELVCLDSYGLSKFPMSVERDFSEGSLIDIWNMEAVA